MKPVSAMDAAVRALVEQGRRRTPEQQALYERITERNDRIQKLGVRPVDGVSFAKKGKA